MSTLTKAEVSGGRRVDGNVIHVTDSAIWIRDDHGLEESIKWPAGHEDVRVGHKISAFVMPDGTGYQIRNQATGRVLSTFNESMPEVYAWAGFGALGDKGLTVAFIPVFNYLLLLHVALLCLFKHFRVFVKGALLFGAMTLPFIYLGTAVESHRSFNVTELWVARGLLFGLLLLCGQIALWGLRQLIGGGWFAKSVGLLALVAFGGVVVLFGAGTAITTGLVHINGFNAESSNYSFMSFINELVRAIPYLPIGMFMLAFGPTVIIFYAMKGITAAGIREHNDAVRLIDTRMA
jgi:hypothetical protein